MSRKTQITLTDEQHALLKAEAAVAGISMAEMIRRAVDHVYRPWLRPKVHGYEVNVAVWKRPDAAVVGRRVHSNWVRRLRRRDAPENSPR
jgi:Ribbon-helix-helix protein, copG family